MIQAPPPPRKPSPYRPAGAGMFLVFFAGCSDEILPFDGHLTGPGPEGAVNVFQMDGRVGDTWLFTAGWTTPGPGLAPYPVLVRDRCASLDYVLWESLFAVPPPVVQHAAGQTTLERSGDGPYGAVLTADLPAGSRVTAVGMGAEVTIPQDITGLTAATTLGGGLALTWDPGDGDVYLALYGEILAVMCRLEDDGSAWIPSEARWAAEPVLDADIARARWQVGAWEGRSTLLTAAQGQVLGPDVFDYRR